MSSRMTAREAEARLEKAVRGQALPDWKRIEPALRRLGKLEKQLQAALAKAESREMVEMLIKAMRLEARPLAEGITTIDALLETIADVTRDEELMAAVSRPLVDGMDAMTQDLETARNLLRAAKLTMDRGEAFLAESASDADAAGEDWATALVEFERVAAGAAKEIMAWKAWDAEARAAADARDRARLERLRKAPPPAVLLDRASGWRKAPFAAFDKAYDVAALPKALRDEIARDRAKSAALAEKVLACCELRLALAARVGRLAIAAPDAGKGLKVLGLPTAALAKLKAALDVPEAQRTKALDALARTFRLDTDGRRMAAQLAKAGVL
jgi:hypothetical protein